LLKDYAYNSVPNQFILAGDTGTGPCFPVSLNVIGNAAICNSDSTTLSVTGGTSYLWSTGDSTASITVSPLNTSIYYVTVYDSTTGCSISLNQQIIVNAPNTIVSVLNCDSLLSNAVSPTTYQWLDCTNLQPIVGAIQKGFHPLISGSYSVMVSLNGCVDTSVCNYIVAKNLSVIGNTTLCKGDSVSLLASGGTSYLWSTGATSSGIVVSPQITTVYSVTIMDSISSCNAILSQQIIVTSVIAFIMQSNDSLIALWSDSSKTYQWIDCATNLQITGANSNIFIPTTGGSYAVIVNKDGCSDTSNCITISFPGINENNFEAASSLYPNPATNFVTIKIPSDDGGEIQIINLFGRVVETHNYASLRDGLLQIDVVKFPAGMYAVRWSSGENFQTQKFSVMH